MKLLHLIAFVLIVVGVEVKSEDDEEIIIIGAGISGIAAASRLFEKGIKNVKILEADTRIGGRILTEPFKDHLLEIGSQWILGSKGNILFKILHQYNLISRSDTKKPFVFLRPNNEYLDEDLVIHQLEEIIITANSDRNFMNHEGKLFDYVLNKLEAKEQLSTIPMNITDELRQSIVRTMSTTRMNGFNNLYNQNGPVFKSFQKCGSELLYKINSEGFKIIFDILMNRFPDVSKSYLIENHIEFNQVVNRIDWSDGKISIETASGSVYRADKVIVSIPLGVLKEKHETMFVPELPILNKLAIENLAVGHTTKIFIEYESNWWNFKISGVYMFWTEAEIEALPDDEKWMAGLLLIIETEDQPNVMLALFVNEAALESEYVDDEKIKSTLEKFMKNLFNSRSTESDITSIRRTKWSSNPNIRGSYSYQCLDSYRNNVTTKDLGTSLKNKFGQEIVYFVGEATHPTMFSTVHGALETGWEAADKIYENKIIDINHLVV